MKFRTQFNNIKSSRPYAVFSLPSETIPEQSMTVQEIYAQSMKGYEPYFRQGQYQEDQENFDLDFELPADFDLTDIDNLKTQMDETLQKLKDIYENDQNDHAKSDLKKDLTKKSKKETTSDPEDSEE